jgi:hypothetical protein
MQGHTLAGTQVPDGDHVGIADRIADTYLWIDFVKDGDFDRIKGIDTAGSPVGTRIRPFKIRFLVKKGLAGERDQKSVQQFVENGELCDLVDLI